MKPVLKMIKYLMILLVVSSCSGSTSAIPAKYNLDNQLQTVRCVRKCNSMDWDRVDNQSFILQTSPNKYYLVILDRKSNISSSIINKKGSDADSILWPGYENIAMNNKGKEETYVIKKIYRFKDLKQVEEIRVRLLVSA
jgi:hypothetical protein